MLINRAGILWRHFYGEEKVLFQRIKSKMLTKLQILQ